MKRLDHDEFDFLHGWIWDRTRAIRKDLRTQRIQSPKDIATYLECLERSARFLLLSTHQMAKSTKEDYSHQQDIEQLNATLMSLKERYIDNRRLGKITENEAEFYAYRLILAPIYTSTQLENELHGLPDHLRNNPRVKVAIELYRLLKSVMYTNTKYFVQVQANWKRFWELVKSPSVSYLMACAAEVSFQRVRHMVLDTLWRVYRIGTSLKPKTVDSWTTNKLKGVLGFDTDAEAVNCCESFGFEFSVNDSGNTFLDITKMGYGQLPLGKPNDLKPQTFSYRIVEVKRHNRAFSAVIQGLSVKNANKSGLVADSVSTSQFDYQEDEQSLFVPEAPAASSNIFSQLSGIASGSVKLSPAANPFIPAVASKPPAATPPNPFIPVTAPKQATAAQSNPFIKAQPPQNQSPLPNFTDSQPGLFDASKDAIKFAPSQTQSKPFANISNTNLFQPVASGTPATPTSVAAKETSTTTPNFFLEAAKTASQKIANVPATSSPAQFSFPTFSSGGDPPSFTPAGRPTQSGSAVQDAEKLKAEEQERQRKAEAEAEAHRQRTREEEARRAKEAAERQRAEAERQRLEADQRRIQMQQQERDRQIREAQARKAREEEARLAQLREKEMAWDALAKDILLDAEDGLLHQYIDHQVMLTVEDVRLELRFEERKQAVEETFKQRQLGLKRMVLAGWFAKLQKKKRAQHARDRRRRLKEQRAQKAAQGNFTEENIEASTNPGQMTGPRLPKPEAPASSSKLKRTRRRHDVKTFRQDDAADDKMQSTMSEQQPATLNGRNHVSAGNDPVVNAGYSKSYTNSAAPIDRTETDWFELRARGIDPTKHRKRSFDSSSGDENLLEIEAKRQKTSPSASIACQALPQPDVTTPTSEAVEDAVAKFRALQQKFRKSGSSPLNATTANPRASFNGRSSAMENARQLLGRTVAAQTSPPTIQHDFGRSVPNLGISVSSSAFGAGSVSSIRHNSKENRAAYWGRKSRFVPLHLYGQGPDAIRAYRDQYASGTNATPNRDESIGFSSNVDSEANFDTSEAEEDEDDQDEDDQDDDDSADGDDDHEQDHQSHVYPQQTYQSTKIIQDDDSVMSDEDDALYEESLTNGQGMHYPDNQFGNQHTSYQPVTKDNEEDLLGDLLEYEEYTEEEEEDVQQPYYTQQVRSAHALQHSKQTPSANMPGGTEDDAIELSD